MDSVFNIAADVAKGTGTSKNKPKRKHPSDNLELYMREDAVDIGQFLKKDSKSAFDWHAILKWWKVSTRRTGT